MNSVRDPDELVLSPVRPVQFVEQIIVAPERRGRVGDDQGVEAVVPFLNSDDAILRFYAAVALATPGSLTSL